VGHINHVRHQAAQRTQALLLLKAPGKQTVKVSRIVAEEAPVIMGQLPQLSLYDELSSVLHKRCPAIIVADEGRHPGLTSSSSAPERFLWIPLTQNMFPHLSCRPLDFQVQVIGRSHTDDLDLDVGDLLTPVGDVTLKTKTLFLVLPAKTDIECRCE
jgi:hypothetical protein